LIGEGLFQPSCLLGYAETFATNRSGSIHPALAGDVLAAAGRLAGATSGGHHHDRQQNETKF
jgi:hypothetical protein